MSKNSHTAAVLARDESGAWTRVIRKYSIGTGKKNATDVGVFYLAKKERWHKWTHGYSPYACKISVGIYLHGPLYKSMNPKAMYTRQFNAIGTDVTKGCLRAAGKAAAWIYYNCPVGTQVIIGQNRRFSTPRQAKLKTKKSLTSDPTDPGANYEILMTGFSVNPGELYLAPGAQYALTIGNIVPDMSTTRTFTYASSNPAVASVGADGIVTALAPGAATITVTANDDMRCTARVPVTVSGEAVLTEAAADGTALTADGAPEADDAFTADPEDVPDEIGEIQF